MQPIQPTNHMPIITIITINRNNAAGLKRTLASVLSQSVTDFEYIVVDGASTDDSIGVINSQNCKLQTINYKLISEPDAGIYNAMNKGIKMATGEYLLFINSGDELADKEVVKNFQNTVIPESEICSGNLLLINDSVHLKLVAPTEISLSYCINAGLTHPNTFIHKSLFDKYGLYNEANKIVSDWEFFLIAAGLNNCKYQKLDFEVAKFYEDGISSKNKELVNSEMLKTIKRLVPEPILNDLKKLQLFENLLSQPEHKLLKESALISKLFKLLFKLRKKCSIEKRKNKNGVID